MDVSGVRLHFFDIEDSAVGGDESDAQRQWRIFHPKANPASLWKYEQHAAIRAQAAALHQPVFTALRGVGDFRLDAMLATVQDKRFCPCGWRGEGKAKQQEEFHDAASLSNHVALRFGLQL